MDWKLYLIIVIVIVIVLYVANKVLVPWLERRRPLPYKKRDDFLSAAELSFYRTLCVFLENRAVICPKVFVREIVSVDKVTGKEYWTYFNQIAKKHVDFVLCDTQTMQVVCAVELDDQSHLAPSTQKRDALVNSVFAAAKIPLFHITARSGYSANDFVDILNCFSPAQPTVLEKVEQGTVGEKPVQMVATEEHVQADSAAPLCPKCGMPMVKRTAAKGANSGKEFYGCANFPKCHEVRQIP